MLGTRNRVRVGEETPAYVAPAASLGLLTVGFAFAYVLASSAEPTKTKAKR